MCGDYSLWFAHPQYYSACFDTRQGSERFAANLYFCFNEPLMKGGLSSKDWVSCSEFEQAGTIARTFINGRSRTPSVFLREAVSAVCEGVEFRCLLLISGCTEVRGLAVI